MSKVKNILLVGVGGQGTLLASQILTKGLLGAGYDVKMSEVHGMAQRGGSVTTQVRFGDKVYAPVMGHGEADVMIAFEEMEALRWLEFLNPKGAVIVNDHRLPSAPILIGKKQYAEGIKEYVGTLATTYVVKAAEMATEIGNAKTMNMILLGALVKTMNLENLDWEAAINQTVKPKFIDINLKAFELGLKAVAL